MSADDTIAEIAALTTLTRQDVLDLQGLSPEIAAAVMRSYIDSGKVADRGAWVKIGHALKEVGEYAGVATIIFAALAFI
jgi:hypothetical protein